MAISLVKDRIVTSTSLAPLDDIRTSEAFTSPTPSQPWLLGIASAKCTIPIVQRQRHHKTLQDGKRFRPSEKTAKAQVVHREAARSRRVTEPITGEEKFRVPTS